MRRSYRERDPLRTGVPGMASVTLLVVLTFNLTRFEGGTKYAAAFTEAGAPSPAATAPGGDPLPTIP